MLQDMHQKYTTARALVKFGFNISKREKFVLGVTVLSLMLFVAEHFLQRGGVYIVFFLSLLTDVFLFWALRRDLKENFSPQVFILPLLCTLAFGLFFFLVPARFLTRIIITGLYAFGLYSLYLSENIFVVSSIRTIALLTSARTVSFVVSILSYFFLSTVVFSLHLDWWFLIPFVALYSVLLTLHSLWTYTLSKSVFAELVWVIFITMCLVEIATVLWFWPSSPTTIALFMTGFYYSVIGSAQMWFERRLFKNVLSEYLLVSAVVFMILLLFTSWR